MITVTLSYSVVAEWRRCGQAAAYRYLHGLTRPGSDDVNAGSPLLFGQYAHLFFERYHGEPETPIETILTETLNAAAGTSLHYVQPEKLRSLLHLELLLANYVKHYERTCDFTPWYKDKKSYEVEVDFELATTRIRDKDVRIMWRQHYDGLVNYKGNPTILEHKTASGDLRSSLTERMLPNEQAVGYAYGATHALNLPISGVLFNGICTYRPLVNPDYRPRSGQAQPLFLRHLVEIEPWMLEEWKAHTLRDSVRFVEDILDNSFSTNAPDSCTVFNQRCKFADLCKVDPASREIVKTLGYNIERWKGFDYKDEE